jgi:hypothetical protein
MKKEIFKPFTTRPGQVNESRDERCVEKVGQLKKGGRLGERASTIFNYSAGSEKLKVRCVNEG